jgi:lipopolysaccharide biosynthesis protein
MPKVAVLMHIYYDTTFSLFINDLLNLKKNNTCYLFSVSLDCLQRESLINTILKDFPEAYIIETPNIGKDIGGKLALVDLYLRLNIESDYIIFLHDKLSPQALNGAEWRDKLFEIIQKENIETILNIFQNNQSVGVVANKVCVLNEYSAENNSFLTVNNDLLKEYLINYQIETSTYDFIAGTMFWIRSNIIKDFFTKYPPLEIRKKLEPGNVLDNLTGTHTHVIERLLGLLAGGYGYKIKGI